MTTPTIGARISLKNILFPTDFSKASESAVPYAKAMARAFGANIYAVHFVLPEPGVYTMPEMTAEAMQAEEDNAKAEMHRLESELEGVPHHTLIVRNVEIWDALQDIAKKKNADLIVLGTRGRTGAEKLLFGSVAEEIFRRFRIPVLTIGPHVPPVTDGAHFHCVLFPTDFSAESLAAAPYALSLAEENQARLVLLNVVSNPKNAGEPAAAGTMSHLRELFPADVEFWCEPETVVERGDVAQTILEVAGQSGADLIVLGVRHADLLGAATHLGRSVAHKVVTQAYCPVLTVRG